MSLSSESFEMIGIRKQDEIGFLCGNSKVEDTMTPSPTPSSQPVESPVQLVSPPFPVSCGESNSSLSIDPGEIEFDTASESSYFGSTSANSPKPESRKRKRRVQSNYNFISPRRGTHAMENNFAGQAPHESNVWDDSSWILSSLRDEQKEKDDSTGRQTARTILTIKSKKPMSTSCSKHTKVQGLFFAANEPSDSQKPIWEDTHWQLPTITSMRKVRMRTEMTNCSTGKKCRIDHLPLPFLPNRLHMGITTLLKNQSVGRNRQSSIDSPSTLYRWLRVRLASGLVRSSFDYLHKLLQRYYDDVKKVARKLQAGTTQPHELSLLESLRDGLSGIWCVYAHFVLEVGCLAFVGNSGKNRCDVSFDEYSDLAISILMKVQHCPLVGNHAAIGISLGRLIVSSTAMKETKRDCIQTQLSRVDFSKSVRSAIDASWDFINVCRLHGNKARRYPIKPAPTKAIVSLSNFALKCNKTNSKNEVQINVRDGIESALLFPMTLRDSLPSVSFLSKIMGVGDRESILILCEEMNRWSRLRENLEADSNHTMRMTPSSGAEISFAAEELPFYSSLEALSDPLNRFENIFTPGREVIWQW